MIFCAHKASMFCAEREILTTGMLNAVKCTFRFSKDWDGLSKTAVFRCGNYSKDILVVNNQAYIPHEVLIEANVGLMLYVGIYGVNQDGKLIIPTIMCNAGEVQLGADPCGDSSVDPTPSLLDQILASNAEVIAAIEKEEQDIEELIQGKEDVSNKVTEWQEEPDDFHYPSEKLVHDELATKQNTLIFDDDPQKDSNNPVKSGGIFNGFEEVEERLESNEIAAELILTDLKHKEADWGQRISELEEEKVDKEEGKSLSENDFTSELKEKLDGIDYGAQVNIQSDWEAESGDAFIKNKPANLVQDESYVHTDNNYTSDEKAKLSNIEAGAQVNTLTGVKGDAEDSYRSGNVNITPTNIGLGNVNNTSDADKPVSTAQQAALDLKLDTSLKGAANGVAELDSSGKVPSSQLPAYVDDVLEYDDLAHFPTTGEAEKIYVAKDTNKTYRWSGTAYVEISASLALGETSSTAYRGDRGKVAYDDSQSNKTKIGTLTNLLTEARDNLVAAINELFNSKAEKSATVSTVEYVEATRKLRKTINGSTTDIFTADDAPTAGSKNPVTSGGVKSALDQKQNNLTFDDAPTDGSSNPVKSSGIKSALDTKENSSNKLSSFQNIPDNTHYPTEKLVKDSLDALPSDTDPLMDGNAAAGSSEKLARQDHVHPTDISRVPTSRKINDKSLSADVTLNAGDLEYTYSGNYQSGTVGSELKKDDDRIDDADISIELMLTDICHKNADWGQRLDAADINIVKLLKRTDMVSGSVTLSNSQQFPFNNSQVTVPISVERENQNYIVDCEVTASTGNVGDIIVSSKLVNGFKLEFTGSATSVTIKYQVLGGMN